MNLNRREYCGLDNQGSTCFLNVVLQTLYMTKEYRDHFKRPRIRHDSSDGNFIEELKGLFNKLDKRQGPVRPSGITRILGINVNVQRDAAEHLELILSKTPEYSKIFMGMMQKTRTCLNKQCLNKTPSQTKFCMLQISPDESQDMEDALNAYLKPREQNGLYCRACKKQNKMTTDSTIIHFPKLLILQLQENTDFTNSTYECTYKGNLKVNLRSHIEVLHHKYDLYAIVRRFGSFNSGHYNVDIKSEDQTWYLFDDSTVSQSDFNKFSEIPTESPLSCSNIYLLVYREQSEMERTKEQERQHEALPSPKTSTYRHATQKSDENDRSPREDPKLNSWQNENSDIYMSYRLNLKRKYQKVHEETDHIFIEEPIVGTQWIKYNDIFKASRNIRTVLTKGEADTGKIPSVVKFILDWTAGNANQDIKYIFPIQFKELNIIAETELNLLELVQNSCESTGNLILEESDKVLIILDGLHDAQFMLDFNYKKQISYLCSVSVIELLTNLIEGSMFPNVLIWITSHPAAANNIPLKYVNLVTRDYDLNQRTSSDQSDSNTTTHKNISFKTQSPSVTNYAGKGGADEQQKSEEAKMLKSSTGEDGCAALTPDVGTNPSHLRELDLSENHFGGSGKKLFSDILEHPQYKLEKLLLRSCSITEEVCVVLSSALKSHLSHLRELDLSDNSFGDLGLKRLSALLTDPQCKLEKLLLRSCSIGEEGCAVLSTALRLNPSNVREIDLSGNLIEGRGIKLLLDRLADPLCKLEKLGLCSCIKEESCAALTSNTSSKRCMYK